MTMMLLCGEVITVVVVCVVLFLTDYAEWARLTSRFLELVDFRNRWIFSCGSFDD